MDEKYIVIGLNADETVLEFIGGTYSLPGAEDKAQEHVDDEDSIYVRLFIVPVAQDWNITELREEDGEEDEPEEE